MRRLVFTCSDPDRRAYLRRIDRHARDCGCGAGATFVLLAMLAAGVRAGTIDWSARSVAGYLGMSVGSVFVAAVAGKLLGLAWARLQLRLLLRRLRRDGVVAESRD